MPATLSVIERYEKLKQKTLGGIYTDIKYKVEKTEHKVEHREGNPPADLTCQLADAVVLIPQVHQRGHVSAAVSVVAVSLCHSISNHYPPTCIYMCFCVHICVHIYIYRMKI